MMIPDPTEEIKAIRHRLRAEMNFDLDRIIADIQQRQKESGRKYIRLPKREPRRTIQRTTTAMPGESASENQSSAPGDQ
ncbi:MAG: hypothetical protein DWQ29_09900 [Planctomycetota bacterium]|nr:MAG: hypothetical protein DWQ29_09900 [Planctomycetota bacterium]